MLNAVTEHYQAAHEASAELVHVTLMEEAYRLLARSQGARAAEDAQAKEKGRGGFRQHGAACELVDLPGFVLVASASRCLRTSGMSGGRCRRRHSATQSGFRRRSHRRS